MLMKSKKEELGKKIAKGIEEFSKFEETLRKMSPEEQKKALVQWAFNFPDAYFYIMNYFKEFLKNEETKQSSKSAG